MYVCVNMRNVFVTVHLVCFVCAGRQVMGQGSPALSFEFYLSDQAQITPTASLNSGMDVKVANVTDVTFNTYSENLLSTTLNNSEEYVIGGLVSVTVSSSHCAKTSRQLCALYVPVTDSSVPWRDYDTSNDYLCVDVSNYMGCHDSKPTLHVPLLTLYTMTCRHTL